MQTVRREVTPVSRPKEPEARPRVQLWVHGQAEPRPPAHNAAAEGPTIGSGWHQFCKWQLPEVGKSDVRDACGRSLSCFAGRPRGLCRLETPRAIGLLHPQYTETGSERRLMMRLWPDNALGR